MITVTQRQQFECTYILNNVESYEKFNSHRYTVDVTVGGELVDDILIEFKSLETLINMTLPSKLFIYNSTTDAQNDIIEDLKRHNVCVTGYPFEPTAENLVQHFATTLQKLIDIQYNNIKVLQIDLHEDDKSCVSWRI